MIGDEGNDVGLVVHHEDSFAGLRGPLRAGLQSDLTTKSLHERQIDWAIHQYRTASLLQSCNSGALVKPKVSANATACHANP
jgi:hypothetical protein